MHEERMCVEERDQEIEERQRGEVYEAGEREQRQNGWVPE